MENQTTRLYIVQANFNCETIALKQIKSRQENDFPIRSLGPKDRPGCSGSACPVQRHTTRSNNKVDGLKFIGESGILEVFGIHGESRIDTQLLCLSNQAIQYTLYAKTTNRKLALEFLEAVYAIFFEQTTESHLVGWGMVLDTDPPRKGSAAICDCCN